MTALTDAAEHIQQIQPWIPDAPLINRLKRERASNRCGTKESRPATVQREEVVVDLDLLGEEIPSRRAATVARRRRTCPTCPCGVVCQHGPRGDAAAAATVAEQAPARAAVRRPGVIGGGRSQPRLAGLRSACGEGSRRSGSTVRSWRGNRRWPGEL
jgi:hypothetical protein